MLVACNIHIHDEVQAGGLLQKAHNKVQAAGVQHKYT